MKKEKATSVYKINLQDVHGKHEQYPHMMHHTR